MAKTDFKSVDEYITTLGATATHRAFYPGSATAVEAHRDELKACGTSKDTIRFQPDKPLPASLVRKIVKYRIAENAAQQRHAADGAARGR